MDVPEYISNIPCDLLLVLARKLDPEDHLNLSAVSKEIRNCLKTGKYSQAEIEDAKNFILQQKQKLKNMLEVVLKDPLMIKNFPNAPEKVQLVAVTQPMQAIQHISNPSETVQLAAVRRDGQAIKHIYNPSEAVKLAAVRASWKALKYIDNPSDEMKKISKAREASYKAYLKASRGRKYAANYN